MLPTTPPPFAYARLDGKMPCSEVEVGVWILPGQPPTPTATLAPAA